MCGMTDANFDTSCTCLTIIFSVQTWPETNANTYFVAPDEFLGNKISSYGTDITIELRVRGFATLDLTSHKIVILQGDGESNRSLLHGFIIKVSNMIAVPY